MNQKPLFLALTLVALLAISGLFFIMQKRPVEKLAHDYLEFAEDTSEDLEKSREETGNRREGDEYILSLLPKETSIYKIEKNGYNPAKSLFSVNIFFPNNSYELRDEIEGDVRKNQYVGNWVIDPKSGTAKKITGFGDYIFFRWVDDDKVELLNDGSSSATTYSAITGEVLSHRVFNLVSTAGVSGWETYKSSRYGFEIKYPKGMLVDEIETNFAESTTNRYVSFQDSDTGLGIFLGVKKNSEKSVVPRPFRTGIPGGDFMTKAEVSFGNGFAREVRLVDCYFPNENHCAVELIWFCGTNDSLSSSGSCDDISLDSEKSAFMEVVLTKKNNVVDVTELVHGMILSFHAL